MADPGPTPLTKNVAGIAWAMSPVLEDANSNVDITFSPETGRVADTFQIEFNSPAAAVFALRDILGYSQTAGAAIARVLPMRHPLFPNMYAKEISGWKLLGYMAPTQAPGGGNTGQWRRANVTIAFWTPPYSVLADGIVEYGRFVEKKYKPATRTISTDKKEFVFYNTPATYDRNIGASVARQQMDGLWEYIWYQVPEDFVLGSKKEPTNIMQCVGKVNSAYFDGHNPGTLLMETPDLKAHRQPIGATPFPGADGAPPIIYTVTIPFKKFDPDLAQVGGGAENGTAKSSPDGFYQKQGHNARVHPASPSGGAYPIQTKTGSAPPYMGADFVQVFTKAP